eukprot:491920-Amphidinium_carterae.1
MLTSTMKKLKNHNLLRWSENDGLQTGAKHPLVEAAIFCGLAWGCRGQDLRSENDIMLNTSSWKEVSYESLRMPVETVTVDQNWSDRSASLSIDGDLQ